MGSVIERVSAYSQLLLRQLFFLDAAFFILLHHNLTSNHVVMDMLSYFIFFTLIFITVFRYFHDLHYGHAPMFFFFFLNLSMIEIRNC